jgi:hypothetical protein
VLPKYAEPSLARANARLHQRPEHLGIFRIDLEPTGDAHFGIDRGQAPLRPALSAIRAVQHETAHGGATRKALGTHDIPLQ